MNQKIVTANRLGDGEVIYLTARGGWAERLEDAAVASEADAAEALLRQAEAHGTHAVEPYLIEVSLEAGRPRPLRYRERLRARGPSVRFDLGKQSQQG